LAGDLDKAWKEASWHIRGSSAPLLTVAGLE